MHNEEVVIEDQERVRYIGMVQSRNQVVQSGRLLIPHSFYGNSFCDRPGWLVTSDPYPIMRNVPQGTKAIAKLFVFLPGPVDIDDIHRINRSGSDRASAKG